MEEIKWHIKNIQSLKKQEIWKNAQRRDGTTLTIVAQLVGRCPVNQKVVGLIPGQGICLGRVFGPSQHACERQQSMFPSQVNVSLPLLLPPFPSL